jgi:hypothetical protein
MKYIIEGPVPSPVVHETSMHHDCLVTSYDIDNCRVDGNKGIAGD